MSKEQQTKALIRKFSSGALRDSGENKLNYYGFRHPLLEQSFAKYMHHHRKMADGTLRDANNWWKGWDKEVSLQSLVRHVEDLQAIEAGYMVIEVRRSGIEKYYIEVEKRTDFLNSIPEDIPVKIINAEECANAIRFNSMSYLLETLKHI
jgi:hypothetical protein